MRTYEFSKLHKILSLRGAEIDGENLSIPFYGSIISRRNINIQDIKKIHYYNKRVGIRGGATMMYAFILKSGKVHEFSYMLFSGKILQKLIKDLLIINSNIKLTKPVKKLIEAEIPNLILKPNFQKKTLDESMETLEKITQFYPYINAFAGFLSVSFLILAPVLLLNLGTQLNGHEPEVYKEIFLIAGGISFGVTLTNLLSSLFSAYLGHKISLIFLLLGILLTAIGSDISILMFYLKKIILSL